MSATEPDADPRVAAVYDAENRWGADDDFFLAIAARRPRARVLDLGCGTGRLTTALAGAGHVVTGVDPNRAYLARARQKPAGDRVQWVQGTSACLAPDVFDVALLTSHVAQVFIDDEWASVLADLQRALVPGGILAFDSRDPAARAWEQWTRAASYGEVELDAGQRVATWVDVVAVHDEVVNFTWHNEFADGSRVEGATRLRFRSESALRSTLRAAGFRIDDVFGGWHGEAAGSEAGELVVVARA